MAFLITNQDEIQNILGCSPEFEFFFPEHQILKKTLLFKS